MIDFDLETNHVLLALLREFAEAASPQTHGRDQDDRAWLDSLDRPAGRN